jgi:hypothetical protein
MHHLLLTSDESQFCLQTALIGFLQQAVEFLKKILKTALAKVLPSVSRVTSPKTTSPVSLEFGTWTHSIFYQVKFHIPHDVTIHTGLIYAFEVFT